MKKMFFCSLLFGFLAGCGPGNSGLIPPGDRVRAPEIQADFLNLSASDPALKLGGLKGKVVVVDFWATWCGPCRMELPGLVKLYHAYHAQGLELVGLSVEINDNQPKENFKKFFENYHIDYPMGLASLQTLQDYGVNPIPATFFIDKKGKIALSFIGVHPEEQFVAVVEKLLAE